MFTSEEVQKVKNAVMDPKAEFVFIPSNELKNKLSQGSDPILSKLPKKVVYTVLQLKENESIALEPSYVEKYVLGKLDKNNNYFLSLGEIRVLHQDFKIKDNTKSKE